MISQPQRVAKLVLKGFHPAAAIAGRTQLGADVRRFIAAARGHKHESMPSALAGAARLHVGLLIAERAAVLLAQVWNAAKAACLSLCVDRTGTN